MTRREFSAAVQLAITKRATDGSGRIHCEGCGVWVKSRKDYEIDHIVAEGVRPAWRKGGKLTALDGRLLCKVLCHAMKTGDDRAAIARAKRLEARRPSAGGQPEIARRFKAEEGKV